MKSRGGSLEMSLFDLEVRQNRTCRPFSVGRFSRRGRMWHPAERSALSPRFLVSADETSNAAFTLTQDFLSPQDIPDAYIGRISPKAGCGLRERSALSPRILVRTDETTIVAYTLANMSTLAKDAYPPRNIPDAFTMEHYDIISA
jgi:hypothetical protein